jgi:hypothetical protein
VTLFLPGKLWGFRGLCVGPWLLKPHSCSMLQPCGPRSQADSIAGLVYAANVHVEASDLHPRLKGTFEPVAQHCWMGHWWRIYVIMIYYVNVLLLLFLGTFCKTW